MQTTRGPVRRGAARAMQQAMPPTDRLAAALARNQSSSMEDGAHGCAAEARSVAVELEEERQLSGKNGRPRPLPAFVKQFRLCLCRWTVLNETLQVLMSSGGQSCQP